jgi:hypothetical protein
MANFSSLWRFYECGYGECGDFFRGKIKGVAAQVLGSSAGSVPEGLHFHNNSDGSERAMAASCPLSCPDCYSVT